MAGAERRPLLTLHFFFCPSSPLPFYVTSLRATDLSPTAKLHREAPSHATLADAPGATTGVSVVARGPASLSLSFCLCLSAVRPPRSRTVSMYRLSVSAHSVSSLCYCTRSAVCPSISPRPLPHSHNTPRRMWSSLRQRVRLCVVAICVSSVEWHEGTGLWKETVD